MNISVNPSDDGSSTVSSQQSNRSQEAAAPNSFSEDARKSWLTDQGRKLNDALKTTRTMRAAAQEVV